MTGLSIEQECNFLLDTLYTPNYGAKGAINEDLFKFYQFEEVTHIGREAVKAKIEELLRENRIVKTAYSYTNIESKAQYWIFYSDNWNSFRPNSFLKSLVFEDLRVGYEVINIGEIIEIFVNDHAVVVQRNGSKLVVYLEKNTQVIVVIPY